MSNTPHASAGGGPLHRHVEIGVAAVFALLGLITIVGSYAAGIGWGAEGPQSGFFPFLVGAFIVVASAINFARTIAGGNVARVFAEWGQLRQVFLVLLPTTVYVALVPWAGIYIASALLIGVFMRFFGRYGWAMVLAVSVLTPAAVYVTFELWFLVALPKGPIEDLLGL